MRESQAVGTVAFSYGAADEHGEAWGRQPHGVRLGRWMCEALGRWMCEFDGRVSGLPGSRAAIVRCGSILIRTEEERRTTVNTERLSQSAALKRTSG